MTLEESASSSESDEMEGDVDLSDSSYSDNSTLGSKLISFKVCHTKSKYLNKSNQYISKGHINNSVFLHIFGIV